MKFNGLLNLVSDVPVFDTGFLLAGEVDPGDVRRQLSRWTSDGKIIQLQRGLYMLAPPYRQVAVHPYLIANRMMENSYVSLQSALAYYQIIPEYVPVVTSMTTSQTTLRQNDTGIFDFKNISSQYFFGYVQLEILKDQFVFIATPEKAILDLVHMTPGGDRIVYLEGLRLNTSYPLDFEKLNDYVIRAGKKKWKRAYESIQQIYH